MSTRRKPDLIFALYLMPGLVFSLMAYSWCNASFSYAQAEYTASSLRDPFKNWLPRPEPLPPSPEQPEAPVVEVAKEPVKPPEITVEGIVAGGPMPQAVIQKRVVRVGDMVSGARITKITKEGVEVAYEGEAFTFPAPSRLIKPVQGGKNVLQ